MEEQAEDGPVEFGEDGGAVRGAEADEFCYEELVCGL